MVSATPARRKIDVEKVFARFSGLYLFNYYICSVNFKRRIHVCFLMLVRFLR